MVFSAMETQLKRSSIVDWRVKKFSPLYLIIVVIQLSSVKVSIDSPSGVLMLSGDIASETVLAFSPSR